MKFAKVLKSSLTSILILAVGIQCFGTLSFSAAATDSKTEYIESWQNNTGETLYNGIVIPENWSDMDGLGDGAMPVPYLEYKPDTIDINVGRQLFVDDFLIEETDMTRTYHSAKKYEGNPILKPEVGAELGRTYNGKTTVSAAAPFGGGVWYDSTDGLYKMWYQAGYHDSMALAISEDGINWTRPQLDVYENTNLVITPDKVAYRDRSSVIMDAFTSNPLERFKMFVFNVNTQAGELMTSSDGIHWGESTQTASLGDCSSIFYNPFRNKWVYSIRSSWSGRTRDYSESTDFIEGANLENTVKWMKSDNLDVADSKIGMKPQLYDFNAVAYESIMLGAFTIFLGPDKHDMEYPKVTEMHLGYSRDGFHWYRPEEREAFISPTQEAGSWEYGYIHSNASLCLVNDDELWFYYTAFGGGETIEGATVAGQYSNSATGLATLRRDGFASMDADETTATLTTELITFDGSHLFVNVDAPEGSLKAEVLDTNGDVISGYSMEECNAISVDSTKIGITWGENADLSQFSGKSVKLRFELTNGSLYSFWVSDDEITGASNGYLAGGSMGQDGLVDTADSYTGVDRAVYSASSENAGADDSDATVSTDTLTSATEVTVESDDDGNYYSSEYTYSAGEDSKSVYSYFDSGYTKTKFPWITDSITMNAVKPYMNMTVDYRILTETETDYTLSLGAVNNGECGEKFGDISITSTDLNEWKTTTVELDSLTPFTEGSMFMNLSFAEDINALNEVTATVEIRTIKFNINTKDKENINTALEEVKSAWDFDMLINKGDYTVTGDFNRDLKSDSLDLTNFRKLMIGTSLSLPGNTDINEDGKVNLADLVRFKKLLVQVDEPESTETVETPKQMAIFKADPLRAGVTGEDVQSAVKSRASRGAVTVASDEDGDYFTYTDTYTTDQSQWNRWFIFESGYSDTDSGCEWLNDSATLTALTGYITISADVRFTATGDSIPNTGFAFRTNLVNSSDSYYDIYAYSHLPTTAQSYGQWQKVSVTPDTTLQGTDGTVMVIAQPSLFNGDMKIDIKDLTLSINSADKDEINTALTEAGSEWTYEELIDTFADTETIFEADPLSAGPIGSEVQTSFSNKSSQGAVTVASDQDGEYFTYTDTYTSEDTNQWNRFFIFNCGQSDTDSGYGWLSDETTIQALTGYLTINAKVRFTATGDTTPNTGFGFRAAMVKSTDNFYTISGYKHLASTTKAYGGWQKVSYTPTENFYGTDGTIMFVSQPALFDGTLKVDIKDFAFTLKSTQKDEINKALSEAGSEWTYETITEAKDMPIFKAEPLRAGDVGEDVQSSLSNRASRGAVTVASDEDGEYFTYTDTYTSSADIYNRWFFFKSGYSNTDAGCGWLNDSATLEALTGYIKISADVRFTATGDTVPNANFSLITNAVRDEDSYWNIYAYNHLSSTAKIYGQWQKISNIPATVLPGTDGTIMCKMQPSAFDGTMKVDIRNLTFSINNTDKDAINQALSAAGSEWTYEKLTDTFAESVTIYECDPLGAGEAGTDVQATIASGGYSSRGAVTVVSDEDGEYFTYTDTYATGQSQWNRWFIFNGGLSDTEEGYGWMNDGETLKALAGYLTLSAKVRFTSSGDSLPATGFGFRLNMVDNSSHYYTVASQYNHIVSTSDAYGIWKEYSCTLPTMLQGTDGTIMFIAQPSVFDGTMKVDIKDVKISLKSTQKDAINAELAKFGSKWTYDMIVETLG